jgi:flagellar protein FlaG
MTIPAINHGLSNPAPAPAGAPAERGDAHARAASSATATATPAAAERGQLSAAVEHINKMLQTVSPTLKFSIDDDSHRTIVKIVDQQTQEVIRQIPTAEALDISKALSKAQGLLIKQAV